MKNENCEEVLSACQIELAETKRLLDEVAMRFQLLHFVFMDKEGYEAMLKDARSKRKS